MPIDRLGWAVTAVLPRGPQETPFAYTVGLTARSHPELLIAGLDPELSQELLNDLVGQVHDEATRFTHGQIVSHLLADGYDVAIVEGPMTDLLWPGTAISRYGRDLVRLQQVVWPDKDRRFPWNDGYAYDDRVQPVIARP